MLCIFFISDVKDTTNFTINNKKVVKHSLIKLMNFINQS